MTSLTDKLKALGVKIGTDSLLPKIAEDRFAIEDVIPGFFHPTTFGDAFYSQYAYKQGFKQGNIPLLDGLNHQVILNWAGIDQTIKLEEGSICFIDTETTGLSGGTGTFAFMVGLGFFSEKQFLVQQYFMRDPSEEKVMLSAFEGFLAKVRVLVSFNGKAFDVPILKTRYEINQLVSPLAGFPHVDLLHLARRIWKYRLSNRSLKELETSILKLKRTREEIPGWMIPQMYVDYLMSKDSRPMEGVFYHNRMDVVSLAALFLHLSTFLENPVEKPLMENLDLFAAARLFEDLGRSDMALKLYTNSRQERLPGNYHKLSLYRNAKIHLRKGEITAAIDLLTLAVRENDLESAVELSKVYEHRLLDIKNAIKYAQKALRVSEKSDIPVFQKSKISHSLEHRLDRLMQKLHKK